MRGAKIDTRTMSARMTIAIFEPSDIAPMREKRAPFAVTLLSFSFWFMPHTDLIRGLMSR